MYPRVTTAAEIAGIMSNPINILRTNPFAPRSVHLANEVKNAGIGGAVYGFNQGEGNAVDHLKSLGLYSAVGVAAPYARQRFLPGYIPAFKGGEAGALFRGLVDNGLQTTITNSFYEK